MRPVAPLALPEVVPASIGSDRPRFVEIDPSTLLVDESYQRNLSTRSIDLIGRIVSEWSFTAFKPPVVVEVDGAYHVVDGQHTAIAAATHPGIDTIPVMVIEAAETVSRAEAFVRHNRDRITVTPTQLHVAMVAAGDEDAVTIHQVCERAGVRILRNPPGSSAFKKGDTLAVSTLRALVDRRHALGARRVLDVCVAARLAPIGAAEIKAVEHLLCSKEYAGSIKGEDVATILLDHDGIQREAKRFALEHRLPYWRAMASVIFMRKGRRRG